MREGRTEQLASRYPVGDKKAVCRRVAAADTHLRKATHRRPRPTPDIETGERYFSVSLLPPLGQRARRQSIEVHKGFALCLTSGVLWAGIIAAIVAF